MTLIVGTLNRRQATIVSDRRLSFDGVTTEDESNKAVFFDCDDARLVVAFTGLARAGQFRMNMWLLDALSEAAKPDYRVAPTISRLANLATRRFRHLPPTVRAADRRTSILSVGYVHDADGPRGLLAMVSNFERLDGSALEGHNGDFVAEGHFMRRDLETGVGGVVAVGMDKAIHEDDFELLLRLVRTDKSAKAIIDNSVRAIRRAADSTDTRGSVGKQCSSVILPSAASQSAISEYHSLTTSTVTHEVSQVHATMNHGAWEIRDGESGMHHGTVPMPVAGPKLGRNEPCWCGGKTADGIPVKYKRCHGR